MSADLYVFETSLSDGIGGSLTGARFVDEVFIVVVLRYSDRVFILFVNIFDFWMKFASHL
ncbi:hypothetical protein [Photorhabdus luminescens]|uniref:hypothetical protein n=1 Tax=Photorhabdus luminescens TaxID=29488 RepID=UPI002109C21A|nr:hypothetical protein [Photorhabdus luminescens]